ncbi:hypothetical protein [Leifsonia sp. 1010]|uniref:hypothetical protein n=1 Tax=Leifsonia sp. 1010 TaxID=2817769 RepID=UPI0028591487|nr:hypothetical protein [Leifsonia sp. 1010]MDR6610973.1 hypothetical protein [Leifsonia sp. 1010]
MSVYYLSSLDSSLFEPVRRCTLITTLAFDTGRSALVVDLDPAVVGHNFNVGDDLSRFILTSRFQGDDVAAIDRFPFFAYICLPKNGWPELETPLRAADVDIVAWGELYRTADDASAHRFDS